MWLRRSLIIIHRCICLKEYSLNSIVLNVNGLFSVDEIIS